MNDFKVIHLVRQVASTSMPWNDLYKTHRLIERQSAGYVCSISGIRSSGLYLDVNSKQRYFGLNFITAFFVLCKMVTKNKKQNRRIIIHVHNMSLIPYIFFLKLFGTKCILNVHNSLVNFNFIQYSLLKLGISCFDAIIPVSISVGDEVINTFPWVKSKIHPIKNGIHIDQLMQVNNLSCYSTKNIDVIIIARFVEQKNVLRVLSVLSKCKNLSKVVWYGRGVEMDSARAEVNNSALENIFEFRGVKPRKEVLEAIDKSIVYLSLSKWEGIGVANIEALSLPTEVILSDIPPHNELCSNLNLTLVNLTTSDEKIANIIDSKITAYEQRERFLLERAAATRLEYDLRVLIGKYINVYKSVSHH